MTAAPATTPDTRDTLGRALRDLRISVTDRCNLRCPYCMPAETFGDAYTFMARAEILTFEEIERIARIAASIGTRKIRLTGGEPLLRRGLPDLIRRLAAVAGIEDLALTTNGLGLAEMAGALAEAGLRRVTVSLDSLDEATFRRLSGRAHSPHAVLAGIAAAERAGLVPLKINCVVIRGVNDDGIIELARRFKGSGHIVRFIEYMDVGTVNDWRPEQVVGAREILARLGAEFALEPTGANYIGEVARRYRYRDGSGEIGIIASVTQPFCGACTRGRLSADGRLITCLFASDGVDLKTPLRAGASDDAVRELMLARWQRRDDRYSELRAQPAAPPQRARVEMFEVGG
jgi:cyclic pyranopterin phosphate synthase